jgi:hypothetical protein
MIGSRSTGKLSYVVGSRVGRTLLCGGALVIALYFANTLDLRSHLWGTSDPTHQGSETAEELIKRAGDALGGAGRLGAIERLLVTATERQSSRPNPPRGRAFKIWLPERFQSQVQGLVTHTLNGGRLAVDRELPATMRSNAEQAVPATFRRVALAFLLRAPGLSAPRLAGEATIAGLTGSLVEFTSEDGRSLKLLLAPTSAHPLALIYSARAFGSTEQLPDQVWRLEDYRTVDGVRFPFKLTIAHPKNELITEVQEIQVNPAFTPADFPK